MVQINANGNTPTYGVKHFTLDTTADLATIDKTNLVMGSTAFVISSSEKYMLNSSKQWIKINVGGTGGGGGGEVDPTATYIYDGGLLTL